MGRRQLYFLIGGLVDRLVYLSYGLALVLGFIVVKLILESARHNGVFWAPELPILVSLSVILATQSITAALSLMKSASMTRNGRDRAPRRSGSCRMPRPKSS